MTARIIVLLVVIVLALIVITRNYFVASVSIKNSFFQNEASADCSKLPTDFNIQVNKIL